MSSEPGGAQEGGGFSTQVERARHRVGLHGTHGRCNDRGELESGLFAFFFFFGSHLELPRAHLCLNTVWGGRLLVSFGCCPVLKAWGNREE